MFLESCLFLLGCQICWHIIVCKFLLRFFVLLWYGLRFLFFHFLFCLFGFSLLFLVNLTRGLLVLFIISKHELLVPFFFFFFGCTTRIVGS